MSRGLEGAKRAYKGLSEADLSTSPKILEIESTHAQDKAEAKAERVVKLASIAQLQNRTGVAGDQVSVAGYHAGSTEGGGIFVWSTGRHNGGTFIDPNRAFPADWNDEAQLATWFEDSGVDVSGWKLLFFNGVADVKTFGCKSSDDIAYFVNLINSIGFDCKVSTGYTQKSLLSLDLFKGSLLGENDAVITVDGATVADTTMLQFFSSSNYSNRPLSNPRKKVSGVAFNLNSLGTVVLGGSAYPESNEMLFADGSFTAPYRVVVDENAWRCFFWHFPIVRAVNKILYYNAAPNAGEVMQFDHGWFVDSQGDWDLTDGQWVFNGCSLPAGSPIGYQSTFALKGNATAVFNGSNIEYQPGQRWVLFALSGSTRLRLAGSNVTIGASDPFDKPFAVANDDAVISLEGCSLPLYGDYVYEQGSSVRELIGGTSKKVQSRGCFPRAGTIAANWDKMAIVSHQINYVSNPSGQLGNISSWNSVPYGSAFGSVVVGTSATYPNDQVYNNSFRIQAPVNGGCEFSQEVVTVEAGRYFQFGFWAKSDLGQTYASVKFLRKDGGVISTNSYLIDAANSTEWRWLALVDVCPPECVSVKLEFNAQETPDTDIYIHHVIYGLI